MQCQDVGNGETDFYKLNSTWIPDLWALAEWFCVVPFPFLSLSLARSLVRSFARSLARSLARSFFLSLFLSFSLSLSLSLLSVASLSLSLSLACLLPAQGKATRGQPPPPPGSLSFSLPPHLAVFWTGHPSVFRVVLCFDIRLSSFHVDVRKHESLRVAYSKQMLTPHGNTGKKKGVNKIYSG